MTTPSDRPLKKSKTETDAKITVPSVPPPVVEKKEITPDVPVTTTVVEPPVTQEPVKTDKVTTKVPVKKLVLQFVPWQLLTYPVLRACVTLGSVFKGKADIARIFFDYNVFHEMHPDGPEIKPKKSKVLYTNHPFLKSSFGYSPVTDDKGQVSNNIRYDFEDYVSDEARSYRGDPIKNVKATCGVKVWDDALLDIIMEKITILSASTALLSKYALPKGKQVYTDEDIQKHKNDIVSNDKWKSTIRESKGGFADYIQFKYVFLI